MQWQSSKMLIKCKLDKNLAGKKFTNFISTYTNFEKYTNPSLCDTISLDYVQYAYMLQIFMCITNAENLIEIRNCR